MSISARSSISDNDGVLPAAAAAAAAQPDVAATPETRALAAMTEDLITLNAVFQRFDAITPDHPATSSINAAKLRHILATHAEWLFDDPDDSNGDSDGVSASLLAKKRAANELAIADIIRSVDLNNNEKIEFSEFMKMMEKHRQKKNEVPSDTFVPTRENIRLVFEAFDADKDNYISIAELQSMLTSQGITHLTDAELRSLVAELDSGNGADGKMNFQSFYRFIKSFAENEQADDIP